MEVCDVKKEENVVSLQEKELGKELGFVHEGLITLRKAGMTPELWAKITENKELARKIVDLARKGGFKSTISQKHAREIMGKNFFGIEEAQKHFGVNPTHQQLAALSEIPFSEAILEELRHTHILVAVFPLSILEIRDKVSKIRYKGTFELFESEDDELWYIEESFARERGKVDWQLIRKIPVDNSVKKNDWQEQQALLAKEEEVPTAQVMIYTIIGYYLVTGEHLFENVYVQTSSVDSKHNSVNVGGFFLSLSIGRDWDTLRLSNLGISSARKF